MFTILIFNITLSKAVLYKNAIDTGLNSINSSSNSSFRDKDIDSFLTSALGSFLRFKKKVLKSLY